MLTLLATTACGELPEPRWLLDDVPRVMAFRVEVVDPGPLSGNLLPIPADRIRDEALPGDVVEVSSWVVSAQREFEAEALDPTWFLCPLAGGCVSTFDRPGALEACEGQRPDEVACSLGRGEVGRFTIPPLREDVPLVDQFLMRIAMVGSTTAEQTTDACLRIVSDPTSAQWDGCVVGYHTLVLGPAGRLYAHAVELGLQEPLPTTYIDIDDPLVPHYNPEVTGVRLVPVFANGQLDASRQIEARPGEPTTLEAGFTYAFAEIYDPRDRQLYAYISEYGIDPQLRGPTFDIATATPGVIQPGPIGDPRLRAPDESGSFSIYFVLHSVAGGGAWARFDFEVQAS